MEPGSGGAQQDAESGAGSRGAGALTHRQAPKLPHSGGRVVRPPAGEPPPPAGRCHAPVPAVALSGQPFALCRRSTRIRSPCRSVGHRVAALAVTANWALPAERVVTRPEETARAPAPLEAEAAVMTSVELRDLASQHRQAAANQTDVGLQSAMASEALALAYRAKLMDRDDVAARQAALAAAGC